MSDYDPTSLIPAKGAGVKSTYWLGQAREAELDRFGAWLTQNGVAKSVSSYKSYIRKVFFLELSWEDMTSDQHSAVRKWDEFKKSQG